jgi:transcriptional regulator with XRE-family HTH domain
MKPTIIEARLLKGLTIQAASELSGISAATIQRWEQGGAGKASAFLMWNLLEVYGTKMDFIDFNRIPTKRQVLEAILSGACTPMPSGKIEVKMDQVITFMKAEGFDVGELEALCYPDKTKRPAVSSSVSA